MSFFPLFGLQNDVNDEGFIAKCNDMSVLLSGINDDLSQILTMEESSKESNESNGEDVNEVKTKEAEVPLSPHELIEKRLARIKTIFYNEKDLDSQQCPSSFSSFVSELISSYPNLMPGLIHQISSPNFLFEARKDVAAIFNSCIVRETLPCSAKSNRTTHENRFVGFVLENYDSILSPILEGHVVGLPDVALHCGSMLRSTLTHEVLYKKLLASEYVFPILDTYVHLPNFDVASDALTTVRDIFLNDRAVAAEFLEREYDHVFTRYNKMLSSENYITRRMSLKLLSEILLDRTNFSIMMKYISSKENLAIAMTLLSDPSVHIQFEAFHVFKIFVANPGKPEEVMQILSKNKVKLIKYLEQFHLEREESDDQFRDEKKLVLSTLEGLQ